MVRFDEQTKPIMNEELIKKKVRHIFTPEERASLSNDLCGALAAKDTAESEFDSIKATYKARVVEAESNGWEHVSVSLLDHPKKTPSWDEMCIVRDLFWDDTETIVQFHPAKSVKVDIAQVLHLWRDTNAPFPMPPVQCV